MLICILVKWVSAAIKNRGLNACLIQLTTFVDQMFTCGQFRFYYKGALIGRICISAKEEGNTFFQCLVAACKVTWNSNLFFWWFCSLKMNTTICPKWRRWRVIKRYHRKKFAKLATINQVSIQVASLRRNWSRKNECVRGRTNKCIYYALLPFCLLENI